MTAEDPAAAGDATRFWGVPARAAARLRWTRRDGRAHVQQMTPAPWLCDDHGGLLPGAVCILADSTLGVALHSVLGERPMATTGLQIAFRWPRAAVAGVVTATAEHPTSEGEAGIVRGTVRAADGTVLAHAVLTGLALSRRRHADLPPAPAAVPDPPEQLGMSGPAWAPAFVAQPGFANIRGGVHGGIGALLLERALTGVAGHRAGGAVVPLDLSVNFVRPVPADGTAIGASAEVVHAGRRLLLARGHLLDQRGRPAVTGTLTAVTAHIAGAASG